MLSPYNATAFNELLDAADSGQAIEAVLLEYEVDGLNEKLAWRFLINPSVMEFENSASYGEIAPHATTVTSSQFSHTTGQTFTTPGMMISLWQCKKSLKTMLDDLKSLLEADPESDRFAPPLLRFSWGSFDIGPLSLLSYSYKITAIRGGEPTDIRDLTLKFKEQPRPLTQAEQEAKAQARLDQVKADNEAQGAPRMPLTEKQRADASDRARAFLTKNVDLFGADVQAEIREGRYSLNIDAKTGIVTMTSKAGEELGVVSQYNGTTHAIGRITTIALKSPPLAAGSIGADGAIGPAGAAATPPATAATTPTAAATTTPPM